MFIICVTVSKSKNSYIILTYTNTVFADLSGSLHVGLDHSGFVHDGSRQRVQQWPPGDRNPAREEGVLAEPEEEFDRNNFGEIQEQAKVKTGVEI